MTLTLGVDVGTYEAKGALVDEAGRIVAQASSPHEMIVPRPGWAEHRAEEDWWGGFRRVTRAVLERGGVPAERIAAVAVSAIGPCMLPVDAAGRPLCNAILYGVDARAMAEVEELTRRIGEGRIFERCGNALTSQSVGPKILWLRRNRPEAFARAAKIMSSSGYLVSRLTGECVIDHYTAANFSPLYDAQALDWRFDLARDVAEPEQLPRLLWSSEIAGEVTARAAGETGLAPGTPVTAGTIDAAAEALSVGVRESGDMMMMYGSTVFMVAPTRSRLRDPRLWHAPWLFEGGHACMAGLAASGTLTHWFRDNFARELPRAEAFAALAEEAASAPPGAGGLLFLPYFSGERTPIHDPRAKGAFFGLNLTHGRAHMFRAVLEGIALGTRHALEAYEEAGARPSRVRAVGGGVRNEVWLQATSDASALAQEICAVTAGASYGDAFLARMALGQAALDDIAEWNPVIRRVEPRPAEALDKAYPLFRRLYERTKDIAGELG